MLFSHQLIRARRSSGFEIIDVLLLCTAPALLHGLLRRGGAAPAQGVRHKLPEMHATEALQGCNAIGKDALRSGREAWGKYGAASKRQRPEERDKKERRVLSLGARIIFLGTQSELSEDPK